MKIMKTVPFRSVYFFNYSRFEVVYISSLPPDILTENHRELKRRSYSYVLISVSACLCKVLISNYVHNYFIIVQNNFILKLFFRFRIWASSNVDKDHALAERLARVFQLHPSENESKEEEAIGKLLEISLTTYSRSV
jgi:hypothetical protein